MHETKPAESSPTVGPPARWRVRLGRSISAGKRGVAIALLAGEVAIFAFAVTRPEPLARVAPYSGGTTYRLFVYADGHNLTNDEVERRYRLTTRGDTNLSPAALQSIIRQREQQDGSSDVYVRLHTRKDGREENYWLWPES